MWEKVKKFNRGSYRKSGGVRVSIWKEKSLRLNFKMSDKLFFSKDENEKCPLEVEYDVSEKSMRVKVVKEEDCNSHAICSGSNIYTIISLMRFSKEMVEFLEEKFKKDNSILFDREIIDDYLYIYFNREF